MCRRTLFILLALASGFNAYAGQPDAHRIQFDNSTNGFTSTNAQSAIEEAKNTALGKGVGFLFCGTVAQATAPRWLEFFAGTSSDVAPVVIADPSYITALSGGCEISTTATFAIYSDGTPLATLTLTAQQTNYVTNLSYELFAGNLLRCKLESGSCRKPMVTVSIRKK